MTPDLIDTPITESRADLLADSRVMLRFARTTGAELPPQLERKIARLDALLHDIGQPPVTDVPAAVAVAPTGATGVTVADQSTPMPATGSELTLEVHGELSNLIAPATAISLRLSEPTLGSKWNLFSAMPPVVKYAAIAALVTSIGYVASAGAIARAAATTSTADASKGTPAQTSQGGAK